MRTWMRLPGPRLRFCGGCDQPIAPGDPVQVVTLEGLQRELLRCAGCAEGDVPPGLPALLEQVPEFGRFQPIHAVAARAGHLLPLDRKRRQSGDGEGR